MTQILDVRVLESVLRNGKGSLHSVPLCTYSQQGLRTVIYTFHYCSIARQSRSMSARLSSWGSCQNLFLEKKEQDWEGVGIQLAVPRDGFLDTHMGL